MKNWIKLKLIQFFKVSKNHNNVNSNDKKYNQSIRDIIYSCNDLRKYKVTCIKIKN